MPLPLNAPACKLHMAVGDLLAKHVTVYLDGVEQHYAVSADEVTGYVRRFVVDAAGRPQRFLDGPHTEDVYGQVEIHLKSTAPAWAQDAYQRLRGGVWPISPSAGTPAG